MDDLLGQLRAYGRQIESAPDGHRASNDDLPTHHRGAGRASPRSAPAGVDQPPARRRRQRWTGPAAAAAAVVLTATVTLAFAAVRPPPAQHPTSGGEVPVAGSTRTSITAAVTSVCVLITACSGVEPADPGSTPATSPGASISASPPGSDPSAVATSGTPPELFGVDGPVVPGTHLISNLTVPIEITVPSGWVTHQAFFLSSGTTASTFIGFWNVDQVYADACRPNRTDTPSPPSAGGIVDALVAQDGTDATAPETVQLGEVSATHLTVSRSSDPGAASCGVSRQLIADVAGSGFIGAENEVWEFYVVDLGSRPGVITVSHRTPDDPATHADVSAMLASLRFT